MQKRKTTIGLILIGILLSTFLLIQPVAAQEPGYRDISVQQARRVINRNSGNIVILDVRNQSEFDLGHLYDAILIPVFLLENGTVQIQDHLNDKIIVYCKGGSRSAEACQILVEQGFTKVYNIVGGITAWMEADYPIYTSYHHVTVDLAHNGKKILIDIAPSLLYQENCSCQDQAGSSNEPTPNITETLLEQNENQTVQLITEEVNGTTIDYIINKTLLWHYNEFEDEFNRTITFVSINITREEGESVEFFRLYDDVQHIDYNLTLLTVLTAPNSENYKSSFTIMNYAPIGKTAIESAEQVNFNTSVTLSQLYSSLGKIAKKIGKIYAKSEAEDLQVFAERYYTMAKEAKLLSKMVKTQLSEYNKPILSNKATIMDLWWHCELCNIACQVAFVAGCWIFCSCIGGWACTICGYLMDNPGLAQFSCYVICYVIIDCDNIGSEPTYYYVTDTTTYVDGGSVSNADYIEGSSNDNNYAYIYCGNPPDMAQIIGTFNEEYVHGLVTIYGKSYSGYYSDLYVYVSPDNQNWYQVGTKQTVTSTSPYWIDFGYSDVCFKYIAIVGYDSANSVRLYLDSVRVTP